MNSKHLIHDKAILNRQPESQDLLEQPRTCRRLLAVGSKPATRLLYWIKGHASILAGVDGVESPVEHERSEIYSQL